MNMPDWRIINENNENIIIEDGDRSLDDQILLNIATIQYFGCCSEDLSIRDIVTSRNYGTIRLRCNTQVTIRHIDGSATVWPSISLNENPWTSNLSNPITINGTENGTLIFTNFRTSTCSDPLGDLNLESDPETRARTRTNEC